MCTPLAIKQSQLLNEKDKGWKNIYLVLYALQEISVEEELRYDYGVKDLPQRNKRGTQTRIINSLVCNCLL